MDVDIKKISYRYAMLPVWTLMYEHKGKRYFFAMNGQTGKVVGELPISAGRAALASALIWIVMALIYWLLI